MDTVGERIKIVRKNRRINQIDFANSLGIGQPHISKIEKNLENPSKTLLMFISHKYRVSFEWLEFGTGDIDLNYDFETEGCLNQINTMAFQLERVVKHLGQHDSGTVVYCLRDFYLSILGPVQIYCADNDIPLDDFFKSKNKDVEVYSNYLDTLENLASEVHSYTMQVSKDLIGNKSLKLDDFHKTINHYKEHISKSIDQMTYSNYDFKNSQFIKNNNIED